LHLHFPKSEASSSVCLKRNTKEGNACKTHENDGERPVSPTCSPIQRALGQWN
jgi:hypothetical protein